MLRQAFVFLQNSGSAGINAIFNGVDKGDYWGRIGCNTDAEKLVRAWLDNTGHRYRVESALLFEGDDGDYKVVAQLTR